MIKIKQTILLILLAIASADNAGAQLRTGAERTEAYFPILTGKRVAVVANQSSLIGSVHLVDSLLATGVNVVRIFSPEHGFRGTADAGEKVNTSVDARTGLEIVSLYGNNYQPAPEKLKDIDIVLFDLQDVGVRFYTYFGTMHYVMESCAQSGITFIVLDRPNPNGSYIDGPILEPQYRSIVGMHPVPLVHAMTAAEYAQMINGEGWLAGGVHCRLQWVLCEHYARTDQYDLPVRPSPNLPNAGSIAWYPTLGLYEGTVMSMGRGTDFPFQAVGHPSYPATGFSFTPESRPGASKNPPYLGQLCNGIDLRTAKKYSPDAKIQLALLIDTYQQFPQKDKYFTAFFLKLSGTRLLRDAIINGQTEESIRAQWRPGLVQFQSIRNKYLLYPDAPGIVREFGGR